MWIVLHINPEPWKVGTVYSFGKRKGISPDAQLVAYKEAVHTGVQDYLRERGIQDTMIEGDVELRFWFWRRLDSYQSASGRKVTKHRVDMTNLQKATEDALHDIFFKNDVQDKHVSSIEVEQGPDVEPCIVICVQQWDRSKALDGIPAPILEEVRFPPRLMTFPPDDNFNSSYEDKDF
jgi:Holliday junction resolvase RusA-like endonuclease